MVFFRVIIPFLCYQKIKVDKYTRDESSGIPNGKSKTRYNISRKQDITVMYWLESMVIATKKIKPVKYN